MANALKICVVAAAIVFATPAFADDDAFVAADPTTVVSRGEWAVQQWLAFRHGHTGASFNGFQSVTEIDYGVTDRLQLALNLEYSWQRSRAPLLPAETADEPALSAEAIFVLIPAKHGRFGLSLAFDPAISRNSRGYALRALMQKDLFGFENVFNVSFANIWERQAGRWSDSSGVSVSYGIAFPLSNEWTLALEANNQRSFDGLFPVAEIRQTSDAYFAGPTIQYDCDVAVFTLGVQAHLPVSGGPGATGGFAPDAERLRVVFRVTTPI